jgi:hypothetical protein
MLLGLVSYDFCALDIASTTAATDSVAMTLDRTLVPSDSDFCALDIASTTAATDSVAMTLDRTLVPSDSDH